MAATSAIQGFLISQIQGNNIVLFLLLIVMFVVAYRVLRAVINTAIVAALSGVFLIALDIVGLGPRATLNRFLFFMVLGTALFLLYSGVATLIRTSSGVIGALKTVGGWIADRF
ncbi:MAG: hypothetical protein ABEI97_05480, partial [Candidatus Nanohaloarchaea archaeon]